MSIWESVGSPSFDVEIKNYFNYKNPKRIVCIFVLKYKTRIKKMEKKYYLRNAIYGGILILLMFLVYKLRDTENTNDHQTYQVYGKTQGTTYTVKYLAEKGNNYQMAIDSVLVAFSQSLSTYIPDAEISIFNQMENTDSAIVFQNELFYPVLQTSKEIFELSQGAFDPTLAPVIRVWGFGEMEEPEKIPSDKIDSLLEFVGFDKYIVFDKTSLKKTKKYIQLNFNAIAQGYAVDVVALFLEAKNIKNYMVEIGGEVRANGKGTDGTGWKIGIDKPIEEQKDNQNTQRQLQAIVTLNNKSLVTSGNYRKFYIREGKKYPHTINPKTGYPVTHTLLSATILANDAITADALGTACMVLGKDKALEMIEKLENTEVFLIYDENGITKTTMTKGFEEFIQKIE
ncbi:membrane-associated lipoprotein involved in thiamine biosynthesis [Bernardetia litoralis DSM 6794]|uniref:FAD:protein FMN transferase n=2 Tax=Bernardetia litoralis TaxID=999 RepID=I4AL20_BERLS|nr:membrane-associated lipoprotein involved in thiamine biosynthesis [Bernardetia litoralis DSM 6794]